VNEIMEGKSNTARCSKPFNGQKIFSKVWQKIRSCQFCLQRLVALLLARLSLFKGALKQLKRRREEHILARVLTIENHLEP